MAAIAAAAETGLTAASAIAQGAEAALTGASALLLLAISVALMLILPAGAVDAAKPSPSRLSDSESCQVAGRRAPTGCAPRA
ncbi:hypothetical protein [Falsiroseomonas sp. HW251]|uniref:hypothetical protein n=1 Tax=Falsiroseomonas sp. HW251 TaxID=3390998 RepID=UPI003D3122C6